MPKELFFIVVVLVVCRMYPVVIANGRSLQTDAVIAGYHIPKGVSMVYIYYT